MKKTLTFDEMENIYMRLNEIWNSAVKDIHMSNKSLYNLIGLKKTMEEQHIKLQETMSAIMIANGAEENEQGALKVPEGNIAKVNKEFFDLSKETIEIEIKPIQIKDEDSIPPVLMDILYSFIILD